MRQILFDSDVLIDVLAQRQPFVTASALALNRVTQPQEHYRVAHSKKSRMIDQQNKTIASETNA